MKKNEHKHTIKITAAHTTHNHQQPANTNKISMWTHWKTIGILHLRTTYVNPSSITSHQRWWSKEWTNLGLWCLQPYQNPLIIFKNFFFERIFSGRVLYPLDFYLYRTTTAEFILIIIIPWSSVQTFLLLWQLPLRTRVSMHLLLSRELLLEFYRRPLR